MAVGTCEMDRLLESTDPSDKIPSSFQLRQWLFPDREAVQFGVRMSVCLTVSSLFTLSHVPGEAGGFQQGLWVLITVLFVCWFPTLDVASILEKSVQRLMGTLAGAALGLACGFLSLEVKQRSGVRAQAVCLGGCIALVTFTVCTYATTRVGRARLIEKKSYATVLCLLTFSISIMPFYSGGENQWQKSLYRVRNVLIGCILGVGLSMMLFPRPTVSILMDKVTKQIELAGEASKVVLHTAADVFAENVHVAPAVGGRPTLRGRLSHSNREWRDADSGHACDFGHDTVLEKYDLATKEYRISKSQLAMLTYDPFNIGHPNDLLDRFQNEVVETLARAMRIQTTVVLIDGIVRNDPKHKFSKEHLELLAGVGTLIQNMLSVPLDVARSDAAAKQLSANLVEMRRMIVELAATVSSSPDAQIPTSEGDAIDDLASLMEAGAHDDSGGNVAPKHVRGSHVCCLLFLQLSEHLALRSVRLYESWKKSDGVCHFGEELRSWWKTNTRAN